MPESLAMARISGFFLDGIRKTQTIQNQCAERVIDGIRTSTDIIYVKIFIFFK